MKTLKYDVSAKQIAKATKMLADQITWEGGFTLTYTKPFMLALTATACDKTKVAQFTLSQLPGCCGIAVSTETYVDPNFRRQGLGTMLLQVKEALAREFGFSLLLATVKLSNEAEIACLTKAEWRQES